MSQFVSELLVNVIFAGVDQAMFALPLAAVICLLRKRAAWLRRFALFNLFLFAWSIFGCAVWLHLTDSQFEALDDAPVWSAFFPFGRAMLNHAAGGRDAWQLLGGTRMGHLQRLWAATAFAAWLLAALSSWAWLRLRAERHFHFTA